MSRLAVRSSGIVATVVVDEEMVVRLHGDVDLSLGSALQEVVHQVAAHPRRLVVDLSGVAFCDGTLAGFLRQLVSGRTVRVMAPSRLVRECLAIHGLAELTEGAELTEPAAAARPPGPGPSTRSCHPRPSSGP